MLFSCLLSASIFFLFQKRVGLVVDAEFGTVNFFTELLLNYLLIAETDASFERRQSNLMRIWVEVEGYQGLELCVTFQSPVGYLPPEGYSLGSMDASYLSTAHIHLGVTG